MVGGTGGGCTGLPHARTYRRSAAGRRPPPEGDGDHRHGVSPRAAGRSVCPVRQPHRWRRTSTGVHSASRITPGASSSWTSPPRVASALTSVPASASAAGRLRYVPPQPAVDQELVVDRAPEPAARQAPRQVPPREDRETLGWTITRTPLASPSARGVSSFADAEIIDNLLGQCPHQLPMVLPKLLNPHHGGVAVICCPPGALRRLDIAACDFDAQLGIHRSNLPPWGLPARQSRKRPSEPGTCWSWSRDTTSTSG